MYSLQLRMQRNRRMLARLALAGGVGLAALVTLLPGGGVPGAGDNQSAGTPDVYFSPTPVAGEAFGARLNWRTDGSVKETANLG